MDSRNEQLILDQLMDIKEDVGRFEANIIKLQTDMTSIEDKLKDSFVIPLSNKVIIAIVVLAGTGISASELSLI